MPYIYYDHPSPGIYSPSEQVVSPRIKSTDTKNEVPPRKEVYCNVYHHKQTVRCQCATQTRARTLTYSQNHSHHSTPAHSRAVMKSKQVVTATSNSKRCHTKMSHPKVCIRSTRETVDTRLVTEPNRSPIAPRGQQVPRWERGVTNAAPKSSAAAPSLYGHCTATVPPPGGLENASTTVGRAACCWAGGRVAGPPRGAGRN
jgi:hypothetical protein